jgi:pyrroloquinoline quinone (PQQ) biosynthesis protein C
MDSESAPLLHRDAVAHLIDATLVVETPYWEFTIREQVQPLAALLSRADGVSSLCTLADQVGLDLRTAARLLEPLAEEGAVIDAAAALRTGSNGFLDAFQQECQLMMRALSEQPFWQLVLSGGATRSLILGWGVEFTHFVEAANEYMPLGIAHANDSVAVREAFSRHYAEEAGHSAIFSEGLVCCGLDRARLALAPPLATTRALINLLVENALEGPVPYAAGFAVMQPDSEPAEREKIQAFYTNLSEMYPYASAMFQAFERHACLDVELGHHKTVFATLHELGGIPELSRRRAIDAARAVAEAFNLFFEGILDAYRAPETEVPRRPARI